MLEEAKVEILVALKLAFRGPSFRKADLADHPEIGAMMQKAGVALDDLVGEHVGIKMGNKVLPVMLERAGDDAYSFFLWRASSMPANHEEWVRIRQPVLH